MRLFYTALRTTQLRQLPQVEAAFGQQARGLLLQLDAACQAADQLAEASLEAFNQHDDAEIIRSFPGLGELTGPRLLAELGDDRARFRDARTQGLCRRCPDHPGLRQVWQSAVPR